MLCYMKMLQLYLSHVKIGFVVECLLMVQWVIGSVTPGGPTGLFLIPVSVPRMV